MPTIAAFCSSCLSDDCSFHFLISLIMRHHHFASYYFWEFIAVTQSVIKNVTIPRSKLCDTEKVFAKIMNFCAMTQTQGVEHLKIFFNFKSLFWLRFNSKKLMAIKWPTLHCSEKEHQTVIAARQRKIMYYYPLYAHFNAPTLISFSGRIFSWLRTPKMSGAVAKWSSERASKSRF